VSKRQQRARVQTVDKETNKIFYDLIKEFHKIIGILKLLNTSFNLNGEPIVCSPTDVIRTFCSCGLNILVIGNYLIHK
jgi:carbamoyltransferase